MSQNARITVQIRPVRTQVPLVLRGSDDQFLAVLEELTHDRGVLRARGWTVGEAAGLAAGGKEQETRADRARPGRRQGGDAGTDHSGGEAGGFEIALTAPAEGAQLLIRSRGRKHYFLLTV